jgi:hypothetical protein
LKLVESKGQIITKRNQSSSGELEKSKLKYFLWRNSWIVKDKKIWILRKNLSKRENSVNQFKQKQKR